MIPHWERWQKNNPHGLYHDNIILSWPQSQSPWWLSSSPFLDGHTLWHTHSASLVSSSLDYCWQHTALTSSRKHIASECDREVQTVSLFGWRNDSTHVTNVAQRWVSCFKVRHDEENHDWRSCRKSQGPVTYSKQLPPWGRSMRIRLLVHFSAMHQGKSSAVKLYKSGRLNVRVY